MITILQSDRDLELLSSNNSRMILQSDRDLEFLIKSEIELLSSNNIR